MNKKLLSQIELESDFQRLEFLGDSVFGLVVTDYIFERFPQEREGFLTKLRSRLINNNIMKTFCTDLGWQKYNKNNKNLADLFESIVGAFYKKKGYKKTYKFLVTFLLEAKVNWAEILISIKKWSSLDFYEIRGL